MTTVTSTKVDSMTRKSQLELALLLPEIPDRSDACVRRLIDSLVTQAEPKVREVEAAKAKRRSAVRFGTAP